MNVRLDRRSIAVWLAAFLVLGLAGCTGIGGSPAPSPGPSGTPGPAGTPGPSGTPGAGMTGAELRLHLIEALGPLWYCDPDEYPVGRDEQQAALDNYAQLVAEHDIFTAVAEQLGIDPEADHTNAQKLAIYRVWKVARVIQLEPIGNDRYRFDYLAQPVAGAMNGTRTAGVVDGRGTITVEQEGPGEEPLCPICLDRATEIATPDGPVPVDRLLLGDRVWTLDAGGRRVEGTVIALASVPAPAGHRVIRVALADGRSVTASPGHPLADGRTLGELSVGDIVDGSVIVDLEVVQYEGNETFDLVVSGETGLYLAGGIALASTID